MRQLPLRPHLSGVEARNPTGAPHTPALSRMAKRSVGEKPARADDAWTGFSLSVWERETEDEVARRPQ